MSCSVAALITDYIIDAIAEQVGSFTLALITPLRSQ
jgi:hypothetical protein